MIEKLPRIKTVNRSVWVIPVLVISLCLSSLFFFGCAGKGVAKDAAHHAADDAKKIIYQVTEQEALELAQWALEQTFADQLIRRLKKPRVGLFVHENEQKGHYKYARFRDATFIYEVDLLRVSGSTTQGQSVVGYTYALKGDGDLKTGPEKLTLLGQQLKKGFEKTGRAVTVSSTRPAKPLPPVFSPEAPPADDTISTDGTIETPVVKEAPATVVPMAIAKDKPADEEDVFVKLKKLKELLDQGIITEEEFQLKKKELLDRI